jgi:hypothetical protein
VSPGDKVELGDLAISVLEAERFRVRWVMVVTKTPPALVEDDTEESEATG